MRTEFKINLKKTKTAYRKWDMRKLKREPMLRQYLVLAYQIKKVLRENHPKRTMREISGWIGYTPPRLSQIMSLLFLSPFIQEEILLSDEPSLHQFSMNNAHQISCELLWDRQKEMWLNNKKAVIKITA